MKNACCKPFHKIKVDNTTISLSLKGPTTYILCQIVGSPIYLDASKKILRMVIFLLVLMASINLIHSFTHLIKK